MGIDEHMNSAETEKTSFRQLMISLSPEQHDWLRKEGKRIGGESMASIVRSLIRAAMGKRVEAKR